MNSPTEPVPSTRPKVKPRVDRFLLWTGMALAIFGALAYMVLLGKAELLHIPWYAPVFASVGAVLVFLSILQKRTLWRLLGLLLVVGLAGLEWWFLLSYTKLPQYQGPLAAGRAFPAFEAKTAAGQPFTQQQFISDQPTLLIFFRGHW
jgi:hypothetical protein